MSISVKRLTGLLQTTSERGKNVFDPRVSRISVDGLTATLETHVEGYTLQQDADRLTVRTRTNDRRDWYSGVTGLPGGKFQAG